MEYPLDLINKNNKNSNKNKYSIQAIQSDQSRSQNVQKTNTNTITSSKMVKLSILFTAGLAALPSLVAADNCKKGLSYCGYGLLNKGE